MAIENNEQSLTYEQLSQMGVPLGQVVDQQIQSQQGTQEDDWTVGGEVGSVLKTALPAFASGLQSAEADIMSTLGLENSSNYARRKAEDLNKYVEKNAAKTAVGQFASSVVQTAPQVAIGIAAPEVAIPLAFADAYGQAANQQTLSGKEYKGVENLANAATTTALSMGTSKLFGPMQAASKSLISRKAAEAGEDILQSVISNTGQNIAGDRDMFEGSFGAAMEGLVSGQGLRGLDRMTGTKWNKGAADAAVKASEYKQTNPNTSEDHLSEFVSHQKLNDNYYSNLADMDDAQFDRASKAKQATTDNSTGAYADIGSDDVLKSVNFKPTALSMDAPYADNLGGYAGETRRLGDLHGVDSKESVRTREILEKARPLTQGQKADDTVKTLEKRRFDVRKAGLDFQGKVRGNIVGTNQSKVSSYLREINSNIEELRQSGGDHSEISALKRQASALRDLDSRLTTYGKDLDNLGSGRPTVSLDEIKELGAEIDNAARKAGISGELVNAQGKAGAFDPVADAHLYKAGTDKIDAEWPQWRDSKADVAGEKKAVSISEGEQTALAFSLGASAPFTAGRAVLQATKARRARKQLAKALDTRALARDVRVKRFNDAIASGDGATAAQAAEASLPDQGVNVPDATPVTPEAAPWNPPKEMSDVQKNTVEAVQETVDAETKDLDKQAQEGIKEIEKEEAKAPETAPKRETKPVGPKPKQKAKEPEKAPEKPKTKVRPMDAEVTKRQRKAKADKAEAERKAAEETKAKKEEEAKQETEAKKQESTEDVKGRAKRVEKPTKEEPTVEEVKPEPTPEKKPEDVRTKATDEDVKGRAKPVKKPVKEEPIPEPAPEPEKPKAKPLPLEPKNLRKAVKGHPLTPTDLAFNRALQADHKERMNKLADSLNTDADTVNKAYSELYDAKGKTPTDAQIKERIKEDRAKAQKEMESKAQEQAKEILDEETSEREKEARRIEAEEMKAENQAKEERVQAAKDDVNQFMDAYELPSEALSEALKEMGQMPGDYRIRETGEPIDAVALRRKVVTIAKRMAREEKTAKNKALVKANQAVNRARTESARRKRIEAQEDKVKAAKDLFKVQREDADSYVSQMHPAVRPKAEKMVSKLFNQLSSRGAKFSVSAENKLYRDLDKLEAEQVGKLADDLQTRIDSETKVLESFINAKKPTSQDTIMKQKKSIDKLIDEKSELESQVGALNKQVEGFDAKMDKAVKEAVDAAEKERKLEAEEQKLNTNFAALEAQGRTVTEQIRKDVEGLENINEQDIQDFVELEFKGKATPYTDLNGLYKRADKHFKALNSKIDKETDISTKTKKKISSNSDSENGILAQETNKLISAAIKRGENEEITRLNKMVKAIQEQTGSKKTNAELALSDAMVEANKRKQRYPNDNTRWITQEMLNSLNKAMAGGVDTGSSYRGNLGVRLMTSILGKDEANRLAKYKWGSVSEDAALDAKDAKAKGKRRNLVSIRKNKAKSRRTKNVEFVG